MSDQDFFFDEDEQPKAADKAPAKKASSAKPAAKAAATPVEGAVQSVSMTVAVLIGVISLLAGVIVGIVLPVGGGTPTPTTATTPTGGTSAPQLTPDQLQGGLPAGHPNIGGGSGATGSTNTTGK